MALMELLGGDLNHVNEEMKCHTERPRSPDVSDDEFEVLPQKVIVYITGLNGLTASTYANLTTKSKLSKYQVNEYSVTLRSYSVIKGKLDVFDKSLHCKKADIMELALQKMKTDQQFAFEMLSKIPAALMMKVMLSNDVDVESLLPSPVDGKPHSFK